MDRFQNWQIRKFVVSKVHHLLTLVGGADIQQKIKIVLQAYPHNIDLIPIYFSWQVFPVQVDPDSDENVHMFFARGERWRRLRSIVNPAFSSTKMRTVRKNKYF